VFHVAAPGLRVRLLRADELGAADIDAWLDLEARALEPNGYLSPHFVLPALRHLDGDKTVLAVLVEAPATGPSARMRLLGLGLFVRSGPTRALPLPHLVGYMSL
jgi:hypothetical protein